MAPTGWARDRASGLATRRWRGGRLHGAMLLWTNEFRLPPRRRDVRAPPHVAAFPIGLGWPCRGPFGPYGPRGPYGPSGPNGPGSTMPCRYRFGFGVSGFGSRPGAAAFAYT